MEDSVFIIANGLRFVRRGEGPAFMRHSSTEENDARAAHVADLVMLDEIVSTVSMGLPVVFPPPSTLNSGRLPRASVL